MEGPGRILHSFYHSNIQQASNFFLHPLQFLRIVHSASWNEYWVGFGFQYHFKSSASSILNGSDSFSSTTFKLRAHRPEIVVLFAPVSICAWTSKPFTKILAVKTFPPSCFNAKCSIFFFSCGQSALVWLGSRQKKHNPSFLHLCFSIGVNGRIADFPTRGCI